MRSFGLSAGRKNARNCHKMMGEVATTDIQKAILNFTVNGSNAFRKLSSTVPSSVCGKKSAMGSSKNCPMVADAR